VAGKAPARATVAFGIGGWVGKNGLDGFAAEERRIAGGHLAKEKLERQNSKRPSYGGAVCNRARASIGKGPAAYFLSYAPARYFYSQPTAVPRKRGRCGAHWPRYLRYRAPAGSDELLSKNQRACQPQ